MILVIRAHLFFHYVSLGAAWWRGQEVDLIFVRCFSSFIVCFLQYLVASPILLNFISFQIYWCRYEHYIYIMFAWGFRGGVDLRLVCFRSCIDVIMFEVNKVS